LAKLQAPVENRRIRRLESRRSAKPSQGAPTGRTCDSFLVGRGGFKPVRKHGSTLPRVAIESCAMQRRAACATGPALPAVRRAFAPLIAAMLAVGAGAAVLRAQRTPDYENPPIRYSATAPSDQITRLQAQLAAGDVTLAGSNKAVLRALLRELGVPIESQLLVFSKTSLQRGKIGPKTPRAIYFSDTCYVGWVPGGLIEITTIDPVLGAVFYTFSPRLAGAPPKFERDPDCLRCHGGSFVRDVPGVFARSVFPDKSGEPLLRHGSKVVDYRTPFEERWGGWYVTGRHGMTVHRGNVLGREENGGLIFDLAQGANITDLSPFFETDSYLTTSSDIVALLVFEYQIAMQNTITRAAFACRRMLDYQRSLQRAFREPETDEPVHDSVKSVFASATRDLVDALLFKDEAPLPAGIEGTPEFPRAFRAGVPVSGSGESLKDLRLSGHIFRNRCSYMIYSEAFLALPGPLKRSVYESLARALHATEPDPRYAYIEPDERGRIRAILTETHPELAGRF
jgi:hypothetical protein